MWSASMPAAASSSAGVPEPGISLTASLHARALLGVRERLQHRVAQPALGPVVLDHDEPPPVSSAASCSVSASIGLTE